VQAGHTCFTYLGYTAHSVDRVESILAPMAGSDSDEPFLTAKGRATRDRIIDCATELVLSDGFSGLSIDNVRKAAAVSGSQMTHYFTDKNSLLGAIVSRRVQVLLDFHRQPALRDLDTFEDFERWADLTMRFGRRKTRVTAIPTFGPLVVELNKCDNKTRDLLTQGYQEWVGIADRWSATNERSRGTGARGEPSAIGFRSHERPPRRRHADLGISPAVARPGGPEIRPELSAHVRLLHSPLLTEEGHTTTHPPHRQQALRATVDSIEPATAVHLPEATKNTRGVAMSRTMRIMGHRTQ
jgi:AcrR family transcriptional regulator